MSGDHNKYQKDCYGDGNVYRGERNRDSEVKTVWVGLTDQEIGELYRAWWANNTGFARAIESALKNKNGF